jgi:pyruvate kinase
MTALPLSPSADEAPTLTKIVATIGPASDTPEIIAKLIHAGVAVFRFNFSHGDFDAHAKRLRTVREVSAAIGRPVACLGDLQGPKIRVGKVPDGGLMLAAGTDVILKKNLDLAFIDNSDPTAPRVFLPLTYPQLVDEVQPGHRVLINDGFIRMLAMDADKAKGELRCRVKVGGLVTSKKGINVPDSDLTAPAITARDWECVSWSVENGMDFLALSFVRTPDEVTELRSRLEQMCPLDKSFDPTGEGARIPVIAKIEMPQAVKRLNEIVEASDGIMVARGDLGVEMDVARVPGVQKDILKCCHEWGRPCIVATQMLETMIENQVPTRAEAGDVATAVFDEADAVMLSAETASGKHPVLVVETMRRIIAAAEAHAIPEIKKPSPPTRMIAQNHPTAALAHGAWHIARDIGAKVIVCWSENGGTARYLSQNNFAIPIFAWTSNPKQARRMSLLAGVTAVCAPPPPSGSLADWNGMVDTYLLSKGVAKRGDKVLLLAGRPLGRARSTNAVAIHTLGEPTGGYHSHK